MNHPIIHIGFPKTGTTWFQEHYFPNLEDCYFMSRSEVIEMIIKPDVFEFTSDETKAKINKLANNKRIIISEELLVGGLDIGFGLGEYVLTIAMRLKSIFSNATIIVTIRNQLDILSSIYGHYIKSGGTYSPSRFFGVRKRHNAFFYNHHLFSYKTVEYDRIISLYQRLFGKENIKVFLYEDFAKDPVGFTNVISDDLFLTKTRDMPASTIENRRMSSLSIRIMKLLNRFSRRSTVFKSYYLNIPYLYYISLSIIKRIDSAKWLHTKPYTLPDYLLNYYHNKYRVSNKNLVSIMGNNRISQYGYPL